MYWRRKSPEVREREDWLIRVSEAEGFPLPPTVLEEEPEVREDLVFYLNAYMDLSTSRPVSFGGMRPLSWADLWAYAKAYDVEDFEDFAEIINGVDKAFREHVEAEDEARNEAERDRASNPSNDRPRHGTGRR